MVEQGWGKHSKLFYTTNAKLVETLKREISDCQFDAALRTLHSIKGSALIAQADDVVDAVSAVEEAVKTTDRGSIQLAVQTVASFFSEQNLNDGTDR